MSKYCKACNCALAGAIPCPSDVAEASYGRFEPEQLPPQSAAEVNVTKPQDPTLGVAAALKADNGGLRYNTGKRRLDLIPPDAMASVADVFTYGAEKYIPRNWERGMNYSDVIASLKRHTLAWEAGEDIDPESGILHMSLIAANAMFLATYHMRGIGVDDRMKVTLPEQVRYVQPPVSAQ